MACMPGDQVVRMDCFSALAHGFGNCAARGVQADRHYFAGARISCTKGRGLLRFLLGVPVVGFIPAAARIC